MRCPWKIHWGVGQECTTQCDKDEHLTGVRMHDAEGRVVQVTEPDPEHEGPGIRLGQRIHWLSCDRREYTGDWPGLCPDQPCTLHAGHHGRHAP